MIICGLLLIVSSVDHEGSEEAEWHQVRNCFAGESEVSMQSSSLISIKANATRIFEAGKV